MSKKVEFPTLKKLSRQSVLKHDVDYSIVPETLRNHLGLMIPFEQRRELSKAYEFELLLKYPNNGFLLSAHYGFKESFKFFEELGKRSGKNDYGKAIIKASKNGHIEIVKLCIRKVSRGDLETAMAEAAYGGYYSIIDLLILSGAKKFDKGMGFAAEYGHLGTLKYFQKKGARDYDLAMRKAAKAGNLNIMNYLKDFVTDFNEPLLEAVMNNREIAAQRCLEWGANNFDEAMTVLGINFLKYKELIEQYQG